MTFVMSQLYFNDKLLFTLFKTPRNREDWHRRPPARGSRALTTELAKKSSNITRGPISNPGIIITPSQSKK